ncbi:MAG: FAD-dependent monooxygenase [Gammaproteobacteria bacterium]|nr:FAD-dependent monooxygenase [Gammaproteobacteria bacterium]
MTRSAAEYDCVIVGAGLVGATLALGCDALGLRTALIESRDLTAPATAGETRGLALAVTSQRILQGLAVWPDLAAVVTPIRRIHVSDRGHFGFCRFAAADLGLDALGHVCPAATLAEVLRCRLRTLTHGTLRSPATLTGVASATDRITVTIATATGSTELTGSLLIAADGVAAPTAALLGITHRIHDYGRDAIVANVTVERPQPDTAFERFTATGAIALLPLGGARYVSIRTLPRALADAALAVSAIDYASDLSQAFGTRLGRIGDVGARQSFALKLVRAGACPIPRALVIGNAATAVNPNAAQGLNLGLRDVAVLIDDLADARGAGTDPGALAATFARRRERDRARVAAFTDTLAQLFTSEAPPLVAARDLAMLTLDLLPPLKRAFLRRATGIGVCPARLARGLAPRVTP